MTEKRLREHFAAKGTVTDARLVYARSGAFRRFGFVGYQTEAEAEAAVQYFHRTYIDTSRIEVALALRPGDSHLPRPWSRYSVHRNATETGVSTSEPGVEDGTRDAAAKSRTRELLKALHDDGDRRLEEFLAAMEPPSRSRTWANDSLTPDPLSPTRPGIAVASAKAETVPSRKPGADGLLLSRTHVTFADDSDGGEDRPPRDRDGADERVDPDADGGESDEDYQDMSGAPSADPCMQAHTAQLSDMEWLRAKTRQDKAPTDRNGDEAVAAEPSGASTKAAVEAPEGPSDAAGAPEEPPEALLAESGRVFVRNLSYTCTEDDLSALFGQYGPLNEVYMPIDRETKRPKGFAFVLYMFAEHALRAFAELDGTSFQGRLLHLIPGAARERVRAITARPDRLRGFVSPSGAAARLEGRRCGRGRRTRRLALQGEARTGATEAGRKHAQLEHVVHRPERSGRSDCC